MSDNKLSSMRISAYAIAVFGFNLMMSMNTAYFTFYLTDIALIPAAIVASLTLFVRVGDMVSVPIMGGFMEKMNPRWGKYRSWLLLTPPLIFVFFTLIFANFNLDITTKVVYIAVVYLIAHVMVNLAYGALYAVIPIMAKDPDDRTKMSARRIQFQALSAILFGYIAMPTLLFFTGGGAKVPGSTGFIITTGLFAAVMLVTFMISFKSTEGYELPTAKVSGETKAKKESLGAGQMAALLFKNPHLLGVILGDTCARIVQFGIMGLAAYYFRYVLNDMPMMAVFMGNLGVIQLVGSTIVPYVAKAVDRRIVYISGLALMVIANLLAWTFASGTWSFIALAGLSFIGIAFCHSLSPALFADASDYSEWKTGKNAKGFIMGMGNFSPKLALIVTGTLTGILLAAIGYVPNKPATPELISGIRNLMHLMPAAFAGIGIVAMVLMNKLTKTKVAEIEHELKQRAV